MSNRQGLIVSPHEQLLYCKVVSPVQKSDTILTINEVMADGKIKISLTSNTTIEQKIIFQDDIGQSCGNKKQLVLSRTQGQSIVMRPEHETPGSFYIINKTHPCLAGKNNRRGGESKLAIIAGKEWSIIRIELTEINLNSKEGLHSC